jgi:hypothetical protein
VNAEALDTAACEVSIRRLDQPAGAGSTPEGGVTREDGVRPRGRRARNPPPGGAHPRTLAFMMRS